MNQHPVPQNISSYEFHLIGNMTIKQFLELGGGVGVGVFFYASNLPFILKWPLIIGSVLFGAALAFLPFEGRPLDKMILNFIRAIYSPTQFVWRKTAIPPAYFTHITKIGAPTLSEAEMQKHQARKNIGQFLDTLPNKPLTDPLDDNENLYLKNVYTLFQETPTATITNPEYISLPSSPRVITHSLAPTPPKKPSSHLGRTNQAVSTSNFEIPQTLPIKVEPQQTENPITPQADAVSSTAQPAPSNNVVAFQSSETTTAAATTNSKLPFPQPPETPNTLVGMILSLDGKIVESAIIEVRDKDHIPVRAMKTNKLGQFFSATTLDDGVYEIEVEKDGLKFDIVKLELNGKIIPPLEIRATT